MNGLRILLSGATGLIGRAVTAKFLGRGYSVAALQHVNKVEDLFGGDVRVITNWVTGNQLKEALEWADVVINLSGKSISKGRWGSKSKTELFNSRINVSQQIADGIRECIHPPSLLISASAVGFYGDRGSLELGEEASGGSGFLEELCQQWEKAALSCHTPETRVCLLRIGAILSCEGGMLKALSPALLFKFSPFFGSGKQFLSWIHLADVVGIIERCVDDPSVDGAINCCSPAPVTAKKFAHDLGKFTRCKLTLRIPGFAPKLILGEFGSYALKSQNVLPRKLTKIGYRFIHPTLESALSEEYSNTRVTISKIGNLPNLVELVGWNPKLRGAQFQLDTTVPLNETPEKIFSFFSSASNLRSMIPSWVDFRIVDMPEKMEVGAQIRYKIRLGFININWVTEIMEWEPNRYFVDSQMKGPYKIWRHEHKVMPDGENGSLMKDRVLYGLHFGLLGRVVHRFFVRRALLRIFQFRSQAMRLRF